MRGYVKVCKEAYESGGTELDYVRCVLCKAKSNARGEREVCKGTKALVGFCCQRGTNTTISLDTLRKRAGLRSNSSTAGLWVWLDGEAGVVEEMNSPKRYRIREKFFKAMLSLFPEEELGPAASSIMALRGLGKEIWDGIDPKEYVERERRNWGG